MNEYQEFEIRLEKSRIAYTDRILAQINEDILNGLIPSVKKTITRGFFYQHLLNDIELSKAHEELRQFMYYKMEKWAEEEAGI